MQPSLFQLSDSCNFLEHYHLEHTADMVTRFRGKGRDNAVHIYITSDPTWKRKIAECVAPIFDAKDD
jgi:hypothetical protein